LAPADSDDLEGALDPTLEDLDNEIPSAADPDDPDATTVDWEKRYKDLQSETQTLHEGRGDMEQEHAESMSQHLKLRFELEDTLTEAVSRAEYIRNTMNGNAQQYQNINWAQVPPDKVQEVQARAQQALYHAQQADQGYAQMKEVQDQEKGKLLQREAAIAKTRLSRSIPGWGNEVYGQIRDFAASAGMPAAEFNRITNPVLIEAMHAYQQIREGASTVQNIQTTRKTAAPRGKAARRQPRDARGKYARASVVPNQRGSFADKHRHRLAMER